MSIEEPHADRFDQRLPVVDDETEDLDLEDMPLDANPTDVVEQRWSVPLDEDPEG